MTILGVKRRRKHAMQPVVCDYCECPAESVLTLGDPRSRRVFCKAHRDDGTAQGKPLPGRVDWSAVRGFADFVWSRFPTRAAMLRALSELADGATNPSESPNSSTTDTKGPDNAKE